MPTKPAASYELNTSHADAVDLLFDFSLLDGSGDARDLTGNLADIALVTGITWASNAEGPYLDFDNSSPPANALISATNAILNITGAYTLEICIYDDRDDIEEQGFLDFLDGGSQHAKLPMFKSSGVVIARHVRSGGNTQLDGTTNLVAGTRYHIVFCYAGTGTGALALKVNDSTEDTATDTNAPVNTGSDTALNLGRSFYTFRGKLLYARGWSRRLSDSDLTARYTDPYRHLQASGGGPTTFPQSLSVVATGTPTIQIRVNKALTVTATGTPSITKRVNKPLATVVATGTVALAATRVILKSLSVVATGTATFGPKVVGKVFQVTATGTPSIVKRVSKSLSLVSTGTPSVLKRIARSLSVVSTAVTNIVTSIIPAPSAVDVYKSPLHADFEVHSSHADFEADKSSTADFEG